MSESQSGNGWTEWSRHVLAELKRAHTCIEDLRTDIAQLRSEVMTLKIKMQAKAGLIGAVAGIAPTLIVLLIERLTT